MVAEYYVGQTTHVLNEIQKPGKNRWNAKCGTLFSLKGSITLIDCKGLSENKLKKQIKNLHFYVCKSKPKKSSWWQGVSTLSKIANKIIVKLPMADHLVKKIVKT